MGTSSTCQNPRHWMTSLGISIPGDFFFSSNVRCPRCPSYPKEPFQQVDYKVGTAPTR